MVDKPTEINAADIDNLLEKMNRGDFDIKLKSCWTCSKEFFPNYDSCKCDECYFSQFPKDQVVAFYRSFFE